MSAKENPAITVLRCYGDRDWDTARALIAPDCEVLEVPTGEVWKGPDGLLAEFERWANACSDSHSEFLQIIEKDEFLVVEALWKGTHDGDLVLPEETVPASGNRLEFPYCTVAVVRDGMQQGSKHYYDIGTVLTQLGAA